MYGPGRALQDGSPRATSVWVDRHGSVLFVYCTPDERRV
jgi:hypothetical protein